MAAPPPQQTATGRPDGEPVFTTTSPPAYSEKEALGEGQAPTQQPTQQPAQLGGQLPQGQYPQGQYPGAFIPQTWPMGYPQVSQMVVAPPSDHPPPHDFLMLALVTTIICGILNLLSLAFGIPAIVFAALSMHAKSSKKDYPRAKQHGRSALILTILNIIFTMFLSLLIIGLIAGYGCADYRPSSRYYYPSYVGVCRY